MVARPPAAFQPRADVSLAPCEKPSGDVVREQGHLPRALDGGRHLALVPAAGAGDPPGADLALLRHVAAELVVVLVVDLLDLVLAEEAGLAPGLSPGRAPLRRPLALGLGCHSWLPLAQKGMSSSAPPPPPPANVSTGSGFSSAVCRKPPADCSPSPREPRNCTVSATTSTLDRLPPSWASHSLHSSRPSIATARPFDR